MDTSTIPYIDYQTNSILQDFSDIKPPLSLKYCIFLFSAATISLTTFEPNGSKDCFSDESSFSVFESSIILEFNEKIKKMNKLFILKNEEEIGSFLFNKDSILDALLESKYVISELFRSCQIKLEIFSDPEVDDWNTLLVRIIPNINDKNSFSKLNSFLKDWAFYQSLEFKKSVTFSIL